MPEPQSHRPSLSNLDTNCIHSPLSSLQDRMAQLQSIHEGKKTSHPWNCFGAVQFLSGNTSFPQMITDMPEFGDKVDIDVAYRKLNRPFIFQIIGPYELPGEFNMGIEEFTGVIHAGLILEEYSTASTIKVFEKNGWEGQLQTSDWNDVVQRFSGNIEYFRFFEKDNPQFLEWAKRFNRID